MSNAERPTVAEFEAAIADHKEKIASLEKAMMDSPDSNRNVILQPALRTNRNELALLEQQLDIARRQETGPISDETELRHKIAVTEKEIKETDEKMRQATGVDAENLAVSCRFLQMELNHMDCELAELTRPTEAVSMPETAAAALPTAAEKALAELRRSNEAKTRIIADQNNHIAELTKCLRTAEARLDGYEGGNPAAGPRVTVTADRLRELKNENHALQAENEDLKSQNLMLNHNIAALTGHCKNMDEHADHLQEHLLETAKRAETLGAQVENLTRQLHKLEQDNDGLQTALEAEKARR